MSETDHDATHLSENTTAATTAVTTSHVEAEDANANAPQPLTQTIKTQGAEDQTSINLRVFDQGGTEVFFRLKRTTPLRKLMEAYCQRQTVSANTVRFLYDGVRVQPEDTPKSLDMEENDAIDVVMQQIGGGLSFEALVRDGDHGEESGEEKKDSHDGQAFDISKRHGYALDPPESYQCPRVAPTPCCACGRVLVEFAKTFYVLNHHLPENERFYFTENFWRDRRLPLYKCHACVVGGKPARPETFVSRVEGHCAEIDCVHGRLCQDWSHYTPRD